MAILSFAGNPPEAVKRLVIGVLARSLRRVTGKDDAAALHGSSQERLAAFAAQTQAAARSGLRACEMRRALRSEARRLGALVRRVALVRGEADAFLLLRYLYRCIGIEIERLDDAQGAWSGLRVCSCSFSQAYDGDTCAFMEAYDSGFCEGLAAYGGLRFNERMTEGAPCCMAVLIREE